jgi:hypothetical protein
MRGLLFSAASIAAMMSAASAWAGGSGPAISYVPGSMVEAQINRGPWTLHESTTGHQHDASGIVPKVPGPPYAGTGTPYANLCNKANTAFETNHSLSVMQPYYFPFVHREGSTLVGYFDYRPRNEQEALVEAVSTDSGATWTPLGEVLALNPYCPADATDPDNQNVIVNGVSTAYGSYTSPTTPPNTPPVNAADNGLGHPVVLNIGGVQRIYSLDRANNHIDSDQLVLHTMKPVSGRASLVTVSQYGFVSPLGPDGYPALDSTASATTGLQNPDAFMGVANIGTTIAVVYVEKTLNGDLSPPFTSDQLCPKTPPFALTNLVNGKPRKKNDDVTAVRVATTTDGVSFTDVGVATGLSDPTDVRLNGFRYLGSGSIIKLANGHYGMFFGGGNCLDNDSDAFHFLGYAETTNVVNSPADLLSWTVINGFDNPILSTDRVAAGTTESPGTVYPANAPIVDLSGVDALTASQVAPFTPPTSVYEPPGGYNSNFFSGRVYDPQAEYTDPQTVTIVFAGYNTPQPSNNLGDYRTIGRFQLRFPTGYVLPN